MSSPSFNVSSNSLMVGLKISPPYASVLIDPYYYPGFLELGGEAEGRGRRMTRLDQIVSQKTSVVFVKLRQGSGKEGQGRARDGP